MDLLCSGFMESGLPSPLIYCPGTPESVKTSESVTQLHVERDRDSPDPILQLTQEVNLMRDQMDYLAITLRKREEEFSRVSEELRLKKEEVTNLRSQTYRSKAPDKVNTGVTLEELLTSVAAQQKERPVIRLSDVKELTIADLSTITSKTSLDRFFRDIEATTNSDAQRIKSAQIKMEAGIQEVMKTRVIEGVTTWLQFQDICHKIYDNKVDMITILRELNQLPYDVDEEPRLYKNRVEARLQSMPTSCETLDVPELIKKSLYKGLPKELKDQVECAVTNKGIDANDFVTMVEQLRGPHLQVVRQAKVREITNAANYQLVETSAQSPPQVVTPGRSTYEERSTSLLADLGKSQQALVRAVDALNKNVADGQRRSRKPWCGYCATNANNHWIKDCPKKPPFRSCFSCLGMGHRKGDLTCPNQQA